MEFSKLKGMYHRYIMSNLASDRYPYTLFFFLNAFYKRLIFGNKKIELYQDWFKNFVLIFKYELIKKALY